MVLKRRKNTAPSVLCPLSECMQLLSGAWAPNIIWYLSRGPRRFSELRADIPAVSAKVLTTRLRELEEKFVITRHVVASSPPSVEYELTELGRELLPVLQAIIAVGASIKDKRQRGTVLMLTPPAPVPAA